MMNFFCVCDLTVCDCTSLHTENNAASRWTDIIKRMVILVYLLVEGQTSPVKLTLTVTLLTQRS